MNKNILSIIFIFLFFNFTIFAGDSYSERLYCFKIISFSRGYEIYCSKSQIGYFKYPVEVNKNQVFLTYEGKEFYNQCLFDENVKIFPEILPINIWANNRGEMMKFKKKFGPIIEKNRYRTDSNYGYDKN
jgi:hypothetical protein